MPVWRRNRKKTIMIVILAVLLTAALLTGVGIWQGWFARPVPVLAIGLPGSAAGAAADFRLPALAADNLEQRLLFLLQDAESGWLAGSYRLAGRLGKPAAARSEFFLAADQVRYGQYLLEQGNSKAFQTWWLAFRPDYLTSQGLVRSLAGQADSPVPLSGDFLRVNLATLRLLAQSCSVWPEPKRRAELEQLSGQLLNLLAGSLPNDYAALAPTPLPVLDPAATPTPRPSLTPVPSGAAEPLLSVLRLASPDLFTMQQLARLDVRWQQLYDRYLPVVKAGYISDDLPLYALAYDEKQGGYLPFSGEAPVVNTEEALLTLLHLCEVGEDNPRSLNWLRDQLFNQQAIYESYHIAQAQPASQQECLPAYAIAARIARIKSDADLYQAATGRLAWHQATSQKSEALDLVFREDPAGLILVTAADNTWTLLAMR